MSYIKNSFDVVFSSDPENGAVNISADGSTFQVELENNGLNIPKDAVNCNIEVINSEIWWNTPNITVGTNSNFAYNINAGATQIANIQTGLYSVQQLNYSINASIYSETGFSNVFTILPNSATGKIEITFKNSNDSINFGYPQSFNELLGFESKVYTSTGAGSIKYGPNVAEFSKVSYFLIQSDITNQGLLFNGIYDNIIAKILITAKAQPAAGSQILYQPSIPTLINADNLISDRRRRYQFSLLTNKKERANTNSEYYSVQLRISYYIPVNFNVVG